MTQQINTESLAVAYLGPPGTYSEEAARNYFGDEPEYLPFARFDQVLAYAEEQTRAQAVLPVENSTEGGVNGVLDLLLNTQLLIVGEVALPIRHQLLTRAAGLLSVQEVVSHPQSLGQCQEWLAAHLPHAVQTAANSNSEAARLASLDPNRAAIAGRRAAEIYGLPILHESIEDEPSNTTRFIVLGREEPAETGHDKTSLVCSVPNTPGALGHMLVQLAGAEHDVNMTSIASRPSKNGTPWEYVFHIDVDGHRADPATQAALERIRPMVSFVRLLGSYPKASVVPAS